MIRNSLSVACLLAFFFWGAAPAQSPEPPQDSRSATIHGLVRDTDQHLITGVTVSLQSGDTSRTTVTDSAGAYRFSALRPGPYTIRAEIPGFAPAAPPPLALTANESKTLDIVMRPAENAHQNAAAQPAFFDEPHFTVAGVTDTTSLGGHGSDALVRNRQALAKATISFAAPTLAPPSIPADPAREQSLRDSAAHHSTDFDVNHRFGKFLLDEGKPVEALIYLGKASQLRPQDSGSRYEISLALANTGDFEHARSQVAAFLDHSDISKQKQADAHHLLGVICEKLNDPLQAVKEFQRAAELNPSESNLFDWGAELLLHHAAEPAVEVFTQGNRMFPASARILAGLGSSYYALGNYDKAAQCFCDASDLNPADPAPYLLMGKMQAVESASPDPVHQRLQRFVSLHPDNAWANYYFAVSLWKRRSSVADSENLAQIKSLLRKAAELDPALGLAYLQLGILDSEQKYLPGAISNYEHAIAATPDLEEAHYRLAQAYRQGGESSKAQAELQTYQELSEAKSAEVARERHEVQQFVIQLHEPESKPGPRP